MHLTKAPVAVREVRENELVGNLNFVTSDREMTEYSPWHIVSMAHTCAFSNGGAESGGLATRKPMNFGGAIRGSQGAAAATISAESG